MVVKILNPKALNLLLDMENEGLIANYKIHKNGLNEKLSAMKLASSDPLFIADIEEVSRDFYNS